MMANAIKNSLVKPKGDSLGFADAIMIAHANQYSSLDDYLENFIKKWGNDAEDIVQPLTPILLRVNANIYIFDLKPKVPKIYLNECQANNPDQIFEISNHLVELSNKTIYISIRPGHFDQYKLENVYSHYDTFLKVFFTEGVYNPGAGFNLGMMKKMQNSTSTGEQCMLCLNYGDSFEKAKCGHILCKQCLESMESGLLTHKISDKCEILCNICSAKTEFSIFPIIYF